MDDWVEHSFDTFLALDIERNLRAHPGVSIAELAFVTQVDEEVVAAHLGDL